MPLRAAVVVVSLLSPVAILPRVAVSAPGDFAAGAAPAFERHRAAVGDGTTLAAAESASPGGEAKWPEPSEALRKLVDQPADNVKSALEHEMRPDADRARDSAEKIEPLLRAATVARGMRAADLRAGDGYFAQVLVQAVHRFGLVWTNNDPASVDEATAAAYRERMQIDSNADIGSFANPVSKPLSPWANRLDRVFLREAYADAVRRGVDRGAMHANVFEQMAPGGRYVIVDARAADGESAEQAAKRCRVPESVVRDEAQAAGFRFVSSGSELHEPRDDRSGDACDAGKAGRATDRFLLIFEKPAAALSAPANPAPGNPAAPKTAPEKKP